MRQRLDELDQVRLTRAFTEEERALHIWLCEYELDLLRPPRWVRSTLA